MELCFQMAQWFFLLAIATILSMPAIWFWNKIRPGVLAATNHVSADYGMRCHGGAIGRFFSLTFLPGLLLAIGTIYFLTPNLMGHFDEFGYVRAYQDSARFLVHPHHFLSHVWPKAVYDLLVSSGFSVKGAQVTRVLNNLFGVTNVFLVYWLGKSIVRDKASAALLCGIFGLSLAIWKYAASGEVYTSTMTLVLVSYCLLSHMAKEQRFKSGMNVAILALFANLMYLSHNVTALYGIALCTGLCLLDRKAAIKLIIFGLLFFVVSQVAIALYQGDIRSIADWFKSQTYYAHHPGTALDWTFRFPLNFIVSLGGPVGSMIGLEKTFLEESRLIVACIVLVYTLLIAYIIGFTFHLLKESKGWIKAEVRDPVGLSLITGFVLYFFFYSVWAVGDDEFLQFQIPFVLLILSFFFERLREKMPNLRFHMACFLVLLAVNSFGLTRNSEKKIRYLSCSDNLGELKAIYEMTFRPGDILVASNDVDYRAKIKYYAGGFVHIIGADELDALQVRQGARVFALQRETKSSSAWRSKKVIPIYGTSLLEVEME